MTMTEAEREYYKLGFLAGQKGTLVWTTEPPTSGGFYWSKRHPADSAYIIEVINTLDGLVDAEDGIRVGDLGHMFYGPLEEP